jgi:hypothetical protein
VIIKPVKLIRKSVRGHRQLPDLFVRIRIVPEWLDAAPLAPLPVKLVKFLLLDVAVGTRLTATLLRALAGLVARSLPFPLLIHDFVLDQSAHAFDGLSITLVFGGHLPHQELSLLRVLGLYFLVQVAGHSQNVELGWDEFGRA